MTTAQNADVEPIAIVGMAARVPGARDINELWRNLVDGVESIVPATREQMLARGAGVEEVDDPSWVPAASVVEDVDRFDAGLFGLTPREAEIADPQHRLFLESCHTALEDAGYDPSRYPGSIGVYGGMGATAYLVNNLMRNRRIQDSQHGGIGMATSNQPSYLTTSVSYRLNLRGPSLAVSTACSTSAVAIHLACEALRNGECDMALAGGVNVEVPHGIGYLGVDGFTSPDGHCRPFDAGANGTVWSSGVGVTVLKRLADAIADGDTVRAVVLGNAVNNDGATKVGFSAPSVSGQAEVVAQAVAMAGVDARTVGYVEAHGTGTGLGDPIEVAALSLVYGRDAVESGWCGIGSVKSNIGHLSQAAGAVAVIKAVLAMQHGLIPPTINYEKPNPGIDFAATPFFPAEQAVAWKRAEQPRRAGVSSFGVGGTNVHLVLEEAPDGGTDRPPARPAHLLQVSAATPTALDAALDRLAGALEQGDADLVDVAHTLRVGRGERRHRAALVVRDAEQAAEALRDGGSVVRGDTAAPLPKLVFLFPGQGAQYPGMAAELYRCEPVFAAAVDECAALLPDGFRELLSGTGPDAAEALRRTENTQPALFVVEYALARLWEHWGVRPAAMVGHSVGEYVAATLAGVFAPADALRLVAARGRLMQSMPPGAMLAVQQDAAEVAGRLPADVSIAAVNAPGSCVVAGPAEAVTRFAGTLRTAGIGSKPLVTSHAFHSALMEPVLAEFAELVAAVPRSAPRRPFLSGVTGTWITDAEAQDPGYWAAQLRRPVLFADCVATLLADRRDDQETPAVLADRRNDRETPAGPADGPWALLECGPGRQLVGLARAGRTALRLPSLPGPTDRGGDLEVLYGAVGALWSSGVPLAESFGAAGRRVPLPPYPYERSRHWVEPDLEPAEQPARPEGPRALPDWFAVPAWQQAEPDRRREPFGSCLALVPAGDDGLLDDLRGAGIRVVAVRPGPAFSATDDGITLRPGHREDADLLVDTLGADLPDRIVHAFALGGAPAGRDIDAARAALDEGFFSVLHLVQALAAAGRAGTTRLDLLCSGTADVTGGDLLRPEHAALAGAVRVLPLEIPGLVLRRIDVDPAAPRAGLVAELSRPADAAAEVALRAGRRWVTSYAQVSLPEEPDALRPEGRYLITGGTGGIGITLAEELARRVRARLVLVSRSGLPPRSEWDTHLAVHGGADRAGRAMLAVRRMEAAGGQVLVLAADVTDPAALRGVRDLTTATFGGLDGLVHAAGLPGGGMAEVKERAAAEAVLAPKVAGTLALAQVFADLPMDFVALCSSVTAVSGDFGQVDYCAANNVLDAYARSPHGWAARVVAHDWGGWSEVGMAVEVAAPEAVRSARGPVAEPVDHPVLSSRSGPDFSGLVSAATHWVLDEHRIDGVPVVPGTAHLECVRAAVAADRPGPGRVELRDVAFLEPFAVPGGATAQYRVELDGDDFAVLSRSAGVSRTHVRGTARWLPEAAPSTVDVAGIAARCRPAGEAAPHGRTSLLTFGPRWEALSAHHLGTDEELAVVTAPEAALVDLDRWGLHPALLDVATAFGRARGSGSYLPLGYGRVVVHAALPALFYSHLRHRPATGDAVVAADLTLSDPDGRVLVEIEDFVLRRVDADVVSEGLAEPAPPGPSTGISPVDGAEAFVRALAADLGPQVVISTVPVRELFQRRVTATEIVEVAEVDLRVGPAAPTAGHVAPRTELEAALARQWAEVMGVDEVGVDEDFFDIGGNSLVAIQLIAQIRKATGVRLPMQILFEESTVARLAAYVEQLRATGTGPAEPAPQQTTIPKLERRGETP